MYYKTYFYLLIICELWLLFLMRLTRYDKVRLVKQGVILMETRISSKGQITLPVAVRQKLRMKTGDILKIRVTEDGSILLSNNTVQKKSRTQALQILKDTAGAWKEMQETGEEYVRKLRKEDDDRWKVLDIE